MIIAETSFAQAVEEFKKFLAAQNLPTEILWVFLEDSFSRNTDLFETHFWLKLPLPEENEKLAEIHYKIGQKKRLGISIYAFALCEDKICCSLVIPRHQEDSEMLFMSPKYLKFSATKELPEAQPVKDSFQWKLFNFLPFRYKKGCFMVYVESKKNLHL